MRILNTTPILGINTPEGGWPINTGTAINLGTNFSNQWLCYEPVDNLRMIDHEHWIKCPYFNPSSLTHSDVASYLEDPRISGIVYLATWRAIETSFGVYDFTKIIAALNRCAILGKKMIVRVVCKVYYGNITDPGGAIPLPANLNVPDYLPLDSATYGGTSFRGGIYPVYLSGTGVGWGAQFETSNVLDRWKALVTAAGAAFGNHSAFYGWAGPDESTRSSYNGTALPAGHSFATVSSANRLIYQHDAITFGASKCWPVINYIDSEKSLSVANVDTIAEQSWAAQQGYNIAFSDTYPMPETATIFMQPAYWNDIRAQMVTGRKVLSHVDLLSIGANDSGLSDRMKRCAIQTYRLGSDITAWHYFVSNSTDRAAYWAAQQAAIDATTEFRP
jgi:hypothetical protein